MLMTFLKEVIRVNLGLFPVDWLQNDFNAIFVFLNLSG